MTQSYALQDSLHGGHNEICSHCSLHLGFTQVERQREREREKERVRERERERERERDSERARERDTRGREREKETITDGFEETICTVYGRTTARLREHERTAHARVRR